MENPSMSPTEIMRLEAARELLATTKRNLQLVDEQIVTLQGGRSAIELAHDVSSEHRVAWLGALDAADARNGINLGGNGNPSNFGPNNPHHGIIRNQEDAAFVCTNIFVAWRTNESVPNVAVEPEFSENIADEHHNLALRLTDANTGRSLITGMSQGPLDLDRGVIAFSYLSSFRSGLGANFKNKLFSEFTIPRAGAVRVEVFNLGEPRPVFEVEPIDRAFVSLFGFKVYGA